jgi:hypothetical protein
MKRLPIAILVGAFLVHAPRGAAQQRFTGHYYPEKHVYLVGEPIIIDFEVTNHSQAAGEIAESGCDIGPGPFEVRGAVRKKKPEPFGCGPHPILIDCLIGAVEIAPGRKYVKRLFLNGPFVLDSPGIYQVHAKSEENITRSGSQKVVAALDVESEFKVTLRAPKEGELEAAYKPFFDDLENRDASIRYFAASAISQTPPLFAEPAISALAIDPITATVRAEGLGRLGTPTARAKLIAMALTAPEEFRQPAIQALGELGNPDDCQSMLDIGNQNKDYTQGEAYMYAGRICKERAIPAFLRVLPNADVSLSGYLAVAFENTVSRSAVVPLIGLLANPDQNVRSDAEKSLETLTHRKSQYGIASVESSEKSRIEWTNWWATNASTAPIYDSDQCADAQNLP